MSRTVLETACPDDGGCEVVEPVTRTRDATRVARVLNRLSRVPPTLWVILVVVQGLGAIVLAVVLPFRGYNYAIYTAMGTYFRSFGGLPTADVSLGGELVAATYADFPAINLWIYSWLLGWEHSEIWWAGYQLLPVILAAALLGTFGSRLGLDLGIARLSSIVAVGFATYVTAPGEDKTAYWWLPVLALLVMTTSVWAGAVLLGLLAGWSGLAPLAVTLAAARGSLTLSRRLALLMISGIAAVSALLAAGDTTVTLLRNRAIRESSEGFWFSIWQFAGPLDEPWARTLFALVLSLAVLVSFTRRIITLPGALVVMMAVTLLASSSTVPTRIVMVLPLGVFVFSSVRSQLVYLSGIAVWVVPIGVSMVLDFGDNPATDTVLRLMQVAYVNAPLFLITATWLCAFVRCSESKSRIK